MELSEEAERKSSSVEIIGTSCELKAIKEGHAIFYPEAAVLENRNEVNDGTSDCDDKDIIVVSETKIEFDPEEDVDIESR